MTAAAEARAPAPTERPGRELTSSLARLLPPVLVFVAAIAIWEVATAGEGRRVIPPPSAIVDAVGRESELLLRAAMATFTEALGGLAIGTIAGILVGFATARWAIARDILMPLAVGASTIPLIAVAPNIGNRFGVLNPLSKMMMAALLVFFPVVINVIRGLVEVQPSQLELMRSYASSDAEVLRKVRVPNMLPFLFTRPQGRGHPGVHRCHRRRVLRRHLGGHRSGRAHVHELGQVRHRLGRHHHRRAGRHRRVLRGGHGRATDHPLEPLAALLTHGTPDPGQGRGSLGLGVRYRARHRVTGALEECPGRGARVVHPE